MKQFPKNQASAIVPIYYFRGALPPIFDIAPDHDGWLTCLSLSRDGDTCLLPLAWETRQVTPDDARTETWPTSHSHSLSAEAVHLTLADLEQYGWQVNGRFTIHFTGAHTDPTFHQTIQQYLWQTPNP